MAGERDSRLREAAAALKAAPDEVPARIASLVEDRSAWSASWPMPRRLWPWAEARDNPIPPPPRT